MKTIFALSLCLFGAVTGAAAAQLQSLVPFATEDSVRVEAVIQAEQEDGAAEVNAEITTADGKEVFCQRKVVGNTELHPHAATHFTFTMQGLHPRLWNPNAPALYLLRVTVRQQSRAVAAETVRFGFRSFTQSNGQFMLNGRPIFLRGLAINPPGRTIPPETGESRSFAEDYVRCLKEHHVNIIRLTRDSQTWFDVCDELGMMVFQGDYGTPLESPKGKAEPPQDLAKSVAAYEDLFATYERHPSVVIYIFANELPTSGRRGQAFGDFLNQACNALKKWDPTRQFIGNAGYGEGRQGDICDVHRYWGWYYNTFLTFYNLRDPFMFGDTDKIQPLTFSECVGCFTGPLGGFNLILRKQLGPQLNWTGHAGDQAGAATAYQALEVREVAESFRRMRPLNEHIAGLMPFSIFFSNWRGIHSFAEMHPTPALEQLSRSYQPVLLSFEMWTPQVYAGTSIHPIAHIINDDDDGAALTNATLVVEVISGHGTVVGGSTNTLDTIPYYRTRRLPQTLALSPDLPSGDYVLSGEIRAGDRIVSSNRQSFFIGGRDWLTAERSTNQPVLLFDPAGQTAAALQRMLIPFELIERMTGLPAPPRVLVIGEDAWAEASKAGREELKSFVQRGGRIVCLRQEAGKMDTAWLPEPVHFYTASPNSSTYPTHDRPCAANMCINPERPDHPVFAGLDRPKLAMWFDYTGWDQTKAGFPRIYPVTAGFGLEKPESLACTAILADYDRSLEGIALCEMFDGSGSVLLCGFDLAQRAGLDPAATRLLGNLVRYAGSAQGHFAHPIIDSPIEWGNYPTERGTVSGTLSGLIVNADWVAPPTDPSAQPLTQAQGEWNTRPGDPFVAQGRSPIGPYEYVGDMPRSLHTNDARGTGVFWARIPTGKKFILTTVKNPAALAGDLSVSVNEATEAAATPVPPGKTIVVKTSLPRGAGEISVRYTGTKTLVLLQTAFQ